MVADNYKKKESNKAGQKGSSENYDSEREQTSFSLRVENYMKNHPEFLFELEKRMYEEEMNAENSAKEASKDAKNNADNQKHRNYSKNNILNLNAEDVAKISGEISGLLFKKDETNKSFLEKKAEEAVSGFISGYLSKYLGGKN